MQIAIKTDQSPFDPEFDALVSKLLEEWKVPGLSIAVVHGSESYSKVDIDYPRLLRRRRLNQTY